jgi:hypothetical protein
VSSLHNAISRGNITDAVKRALGNTKGDTGVERFSETLDVIMNPWSMPEWQLYRGDFFAAMDGVQAAFAAEFSCVALINPAGSGILAVVESISSTNATASNLTLEVTSEAVIRAALTGLEIKGLFRDRRRTATSTILSVLVGTEATAVGGEVEQIAGPLGVTVAFLSVPYVLPPGQGLIVRSTTLVQQCRANFAWRERVAYPDELQL